VGLLHWSLASSITLCFTPTHTSIRRCIIIIYIPHFCLVSSLLNYAPDFVCNWIEVRDVRWPQIWKFTGVTTISETVALSKWRQDRLFGLRPHARRIYQNQHCSIAAYISKSLKTSEETNNPVWAHDVQAAYSIS